MRARKLLPGFTIVEIIVGMGVLVLFALGIYSTLNVVYRTTTQARLRVTATAILSEELEVVRGLAYPDVGVVNGIPPGVLAPQKQVARGGNEFLVTTTVRNIDDPFDRTATSTPPDTAPADYKLVEISAQCLNCLQQTPVTESTRVAPPGLEIITTNGNLTIRVINAVGAPVPDALVQVKNSFVSPPVNLTDTTDQKGFLHLIDVRPSVLGYDITVSRAGYSRDYTVSSSPAVPNPVKPPATVVTQQTTDIGFAIDRVGAITLETVRNTQCTPAPNASLTLQGKKLIGQLPDVPKYSSLHTTGGSAEITIPNLEWDDYNVSVTGTTWDIQGTIPLTPLKLLPTAAERLITVLAPHTTHSLLVKVKDNGTGAPVSGATVDINGNGEQFALLTGLGVAAQTDWSGGSGQNQYLSQDKYWSDSGTVDINQPKGDVKLKRVGQNYLASGWLESSTLDVGSNVTFDALRFSPLAQPPEAGPQSVLLQLATSKNLNPQSWNFIGPDGTNASFYSATSTAIHPSHNGDRYLRYRLYLATANSQFTPQVADVAISYTTRCTPPGQVWFGGLKGGNYTLTVTHPAYTPANGLVVVNGRTETTVNLSPP